MNLSLLIFNIPEISGNSTTLATTMGSGYLASMLDKPLNGLSDKLIGYYNSVAKDVIEDVATHNEELRHSIAAIDKDIAALSAATTKCE